MRPILLTAAGNPENQDRGLVVSVGLATVLCVADGAGGRSGGTEAAVMAIEFVRKNAAKAVDSESCAELLRALDSAIERDGVAGETTCALAVVTADQVFGASVGDSGVWFVSPSGGRLDLTQGQHRKPMLGSGSAWAVGFGHPRQRGQLLLATDGLLKYTSGERITAVCREQPLESAARRLVELVRLPSGALPDDVTVVLAEI